MEDMLAHVFSKVDDKLKKEILKEILAHRNKQGFNALELAKELKQDEIVDILRKQSE